jgi:hypothetical protein
MGSEEGVVLAVTVHQPDERLAAMIEGHLPTLASCYAAAVAFSSQETHPNILELLRQHGFHVHVDTEASLGIQRIGEVRRRTVGAGLEAGTSHLQMCDFDRAIHWVAYYPEELKDVIDDIRSHDLLVLGRTKRAWATHPPYQAVTEPLFNHVFALATGLEWDVGAGSRGLSRRAAEILLETSREQTVGTDAEWPLLILNQDGFVASQRLCEGLEFETADRFGPEIDAAGGYRAWEAQASADPKQWVFRLEIALLIAQAAARNPTAKTNQAMER